MKEFLLGREQAAEFLGLPPGQKILDVATGTGTLACELAKKGHAVTGIDLSVNVINQAKKKYSGNLNLSFRQADATHLPFKDNAFDVAAISFTLHDLSYENEIRVLQEMKRVTKPQGHLLIVDYNEPGKHIAANIFSPLIKLFESTDFSPFINLGIDNLLKEVNLKVSKRTTYLGIIQIVLIDC